VNPVACEKCARVIDFADADLVDSPTGYSIYCDECYEGIMVDEEENESGQDQKEHFEDEHFWLRSDPGFEKWLDFLDNNADSNRNDLKEDCENATRHGD
jgi:hypothetical protein